MTPEPSSINITERAAIVLQQIYAALSLAEKATPGPWRCLDDANNHWGMVEVHGPRVRVIGFTQATDVSFSQGITTRHDRDFIAASRTLLPASMRMLKTAIEGFLAIASYSTGHAHFQADKSLTTLCDQWEETK